MCCVMLCGVVLVCDVLLVGCARFVPCYTEKRSCVYIQNAPVCAFNTPASPRHGTVLKVHTGAF